MKKIQIVLAVLLFAAVLACGGGDNAVILSRPVLVGALLNGDPQGDPDTQAAVRLAADDVNQYLAGVGSKLRIELQVEAAGLNPDRAVQGLSRLQQAGAAIVVGPESSLELQALLSMAAGGRTVLISHCSTASSLAVADGVFRLVPSDLSQTRVIAGRMAASGAARAVLVYRDDVFGRDLTASLRPELVSRGITILGALAYDVNTTQFTPLVTQLNDLVQANPGCVVQLSAFGPDATALFESAASFSGLAAVRWFGSDGTAKSLQILNSPAAARFALDTAFESPLFGVPETEKTRAVSARVGAASGVAEPQVCSLTAYDAVWLAAMTMLAASDGGYTALKTMLPITAYSYCGASGRTKLNSAGDRVGGVYDIWVESGNTWVVGARVVDP
ncbi:MAG: ABC transporter substrate-binding protein [Deltaproteobacteria bacterium]